MCEIYSSTDPLLYQVRTRSVRISGVVTSVRLEERFWQILDEIAVSESLSTGQFLGALYDEVISRRGEIGNFASLLRVICTVYLEKHAAAPQSKDAAAKVAYRL
jgi:predicted DNA-binding ribbon-helix-helix protein